MARNTANIPKRNSLQRQRELEQDWKDLSSLGKLYISGEVILYSIDDVVIMSGWSRKVILKLFNDPAFPSIDYGKKKLVENHALIQFFSVKHERDNNSYWRQQK